MVKITELEPDISVSGQLSDADFAEIAARGFRSVVNNRPDGEAPDQLPNAAAEAAARRNGLEFRHQPVTYPMLTDDRTVATFARLREELPGPVLFYCRSGRRCASLWAQASAERLGVEPTLQIAWKAGYDLDALRDLLEARAAGSLPETDAGG
jgi:sulfide:quinone oxidoreductase